MSLKPVIRLRSIRRAPSKQHILIKLEENLVQTNIASLIIELSFKIEGRTDNWGEPETLKITLRQPILIDPTNQQD